MFASAVDYISSPYACLCRACFQISNKNTAKRFNPEKNF